MNHRNSVSRTVGPTPVPDTGRHAGVLLGLLVLFSVCAMYSPLATAECADIDVDVTLASQCRWSSWQTIDELESISSLPAADSGRFCRGGWRSCRVQTNGNSFRSRYCDGAAATATGPAAECPPAPDDSDIANAPLFLTASIDPNIMFMLDDSGSMQWEHMPDHTMYFTVYVFPRPSSVYGGSVYTNQVPDFDDDNIHNVFSRSPQNNAVFYNPLVEYTPWVDFGNNPQDDAPPDAAPYNPADSSRGTLDLTQQQSQSAYWFRNVVNDDPGQAWYTCSYPYYCDQSFYPITFYTYKGDGDRHDPDNYVKYQIRGSSGYKLDLDGGSETSVTNFTWYDDEGNEVFNRTVLEERQNFANWFTYYRSRILAARAGIGFAFAAQGEGMRVGFGAINEDAHTIDGVTSDHAIMKGVRPFTGVDREEFFDSLYEHTINTDGTPLRRALDAAGEYYRRDDNPGPWGDTPGEDVNEDHLTCRQSYTILMTDGFWNGSNPSVGNVDNSAGPVISNPDGDEYQYTAADPYRDTWSDTLADVAMRHWKSDLRTDVDNRVPTHPKNPAFWQHMSTFGIGLGVSGTVNEADAWNAVETGDAIAWPDPSASNPGKLDDLLHAALNGHGGFFAASDPDVFASELSEILDAIVARVDTSANSAASSSAVLQSDTLLYTAGFRSGDWSGTLTARKINSDGSLEPAGCDACWDAEALLRVRSPGSRSLFTVSSDTGSGVALAWNNLGAVQQNAMNRGVDNSSDGLGEERLAWLAGTEHDDFRSRNETGQLRLLGDFIYSDPQFREDVLYIGGNDGMLHAFDGTTGAELFAYIPSALLEPEPGRSHAPLSRLMDPAYSHRYYMDGTVTVADLTIGGEQKTLLVGGMGAGGRTIFALDVTDPHNFAADDILWEFTHAELGYRAGAPAIVRMNDGLTDDAWAVVFGNGYNSDSGKASLFIVDLASGTLIEQIETNDETPNGLAAPFVTDWPDGNLRASRIYAGDIQGNLWVFDVSSTTSNQWTNAGNRRILITAMDDDGDRQPITSRPYGARIDTGDVMIAFGTGSYFRTQDSLDDNVQSLYGVTDQASPEADPLTRADDLLEQEILIEVTPGAGETGEGKVLRLVSDNEPDPDIHKGWYLDLETETGERVINGPRALGRDEQRVRFTTLIPDEDPCGSGRRGFLMDILLKSGGRTETAVFDLNGDFVFDEGDLIDFFGSGTELPPSGIGFGTGESPVVVDVRGSGAAGGGDYQLICDGQGNCEIGRPSDITVGRQSWRQLR